MNSFACPTCGASLHVTGDETEVTCEYCGNTVIVPDTLRKPSTPDPQSPHISVVRMDSEQLAQGMMGGLMQEVIHEAMEERAREHQQFNQTGYVQPVMPIRRRRSGCGCSGCFSTLILLIVIGAVVLGILGRAMPSMIPSILTQVSDVIDLRPPKIDSFSVSPSQVTNGGTVTARWSFEGSTTGTIDLLTPSGSVQKTTTIETANGSYQLLIRGQSGDTFTIRLTIGHGALSQTRNTRVTIN
jgi:hypothetical protein